MSQCADCQGTGKDSTKTEAYKLAHPGALQRGEYLRCWTCNGNGLEPIYPSSRCSPSHETVTQVL